MNLVLCCGTPHTDLQYLLLQLFGKSFFGAMAHGNITILEQLSFRATKKTNNTLSSRPVTNQKSLTMHWRRFFFTFRYSYSSEIYTEPLCLQSVNIHQICFKKQSLLFILPNKYHACITLLLIIVVVVCTSCSSLSKSTSSNVVAVRHKYQFSRLLLLYSSLLILQKPTDGIPWIQVQQ